MNSCSKEDSNPRALKLIAGLQKKRKKKRRRKKRKPVLSIFRSKALLLDVSRAPGSRATFIARNVVEKTWFRACFTAPRAGTCAVSFPPSSPPPARGRRTKVEAKYRRRGRRRRRVFFHPRRLACNSRAPCIFSRRRRGRRRLRASRDNEQVSPFLLPSFESLLSTIFVSYKTSFPPRNGVVKHRFFLLSFIFFRACLFRGGREGREDSFFRQKGGMDK